MAATTAATTSKAIPQHPKAEVLSFTSFRTKVVPTFQDPGLRDREMFIA